MRRPGPYLTLLAGVVVAVVFGVLDLRANSSAQPSAASPSGPATKVAQPTESATPSPSVLPSTSPSGSARAPARANYAGHTVGQVATVAIAVRDGRAVAYVCDGRRAEAWLLGAASDGQLDLTAAGRAHLTAQLSKRKASGTVVLGKQKWAFAVPVVQAPNGLYRANATVGGVRFRGGWIVLPDGQTGVATGTGTPGPAPALDPAAGAVSIDGNQVPVAPVSGLTGGWL